MRQALSEIDCRVAQRGVPVEPRTIMRPLKRCVAGAALRLRGFGQALA